MTEDVEHNKDKKPEMDKVNQRLQNLTAQAAAKKKEGAAKPGAAHRGMTQFLGGRLPAWALLLSSWPLPVLSGFVAVDLL